MKKTSFYGLENWELMDSKHLHVWKGYDRYYTYYVARVKGMTLYAVYDGEFVTEMGVSASDMWASEREVYKLTKWEQVVMGMNYNDFGKYMADKWNDTVDDICTAFLDTVHWGVGGDDLEESADDFFNVVIGDVDGTVKPEEFIDMIVDALND